MVYCADGLVAHAQQLFQDGGHAILPRAELDTFQLRALTPIFLPPVSPFSPGSVSLLDPYAFLSHDPRAFSLEFVSVKDRAGNLGVRPALAAAKPPGVSEAIVPRHVMLAGAASEITTGAGQNPPPTPLSGTAVLQFDRPVQGSLTTIVQRWDHGVPVTKTDGTDDDSDFGLDSDDPPDKDIRIDISGGRDPETRNSRTDQDAVDTNELDDQPGDGSPRDDTNIRMAAPDSCTIAPSSKAETVLTPPAGRRAEGMVTVRLSARDEAAETLNQAAGKVVLDPPSLVRRIDYSARDATGARTVSGTLWGASGSFSLQGDRTWVVAYHATDRFDHREKPKVVIVHGEPSS
jgi:hypothetical protein